MKLHRILFCLILQIILIPYALFSDQLRESAISDSITPCIIGNVAAHPEVWGEGIFFPDPPPPYPAIAMLSLTSHGDSSITYTDAAGDYGFMYTSVIPWVCISPFKAYKGNNVFSYDASLILRHLAGTSLIDPNRLPFADANRNFIIDYGDAEDIQLYRVNELAFQSDNNTSDVGRVLCDQEKYCFSPLNQSVTDVDFTNCFVCGNVNVSWREMDWPWPLPCQEVILELQLEQESISRAESTFIGVSINFESSYSDLLSFDLSMGYDNSKLIVVA